MKDVFLLALGELIRKEISAGQLLQHAVDVMAELLQADRGTIFLLEPQGEELVSVVAHLPELTEIRVPLSQGVAGYVARSERIVNIPYCDSDARFWKAVDKQTGYTTRSMLAGPLHDTGGRLLGVIQFLNKREGIFTDHDEDTFAVLGKQVASLLEETTLGQGRDYLTLSQEERGDIDDDELPIGDRINRIIGYGPAMREVFRHIRRVAPTEATILLRGDSGTGKGLVARALHYNSPRCESPFLHVDCTTFPEGLMENELFGHERGAYTGAHSMKIGQVEAAAGGTLFLDEIGDLPPNLQGKLLTLLQERTFYRVGSTQRLQADIRIIAATNRDLEKLVEEGAFRKDLYYRLRVVQIVLPLLRERGREDLLRLINHFVDKAAHKHNRPIRCITPEALHLLLHHSWPGNVRELENCLESAVIFSDGDLSPDCLPLPRSDRPSSSPSLSLLPQPSPPSNSPFTDRPPLRELERRYITYLLNQTEGNRSACARILGVGRNTLLRKIREYDLD